MVNISNIRTKVEGLVFTQFLPYVTTEDDIKSLIKENEKSGRKLVNYVTGINSTAIIWELEDNKKITKGRDNG